MTKPLPALVKHGLLIALIPLWGCTTLVDSDRVQCKVNSDCSNRGGLFANSLCVENLCKPNPTWGCLSTKRAPAGPGPFQVTVPGAADVMSQQPLLGATISVCRKLDVVCNSPVDTQSADTLQGVTFTLESGFTGYLQANVSGYLPSLYFFNPSVDRDMTTAMIPVASQSEYYALMSVLGLSPDTTRGSAVLMAYDCAGNTAAGVSFSSPNSDGLTKPFYYSDGLPSSFATATDALGYGGMANLQPGSVSVYSYLASPAADYPVVSLIVRPFALSFAQVVPYAN